MCKCVCIFNNRPNLRFVLSRFTFLHLSFFFTYKSYKVFGFQHTLSFSLSLSLRVQLILFCLFFFFIFRLFFFVILFSLTPFTRSKFALFYLTRAHSFINLFRYINYGNDSVIVKIIVTII